MQVTSEPCEDGVLPFYALLVVHNGMVLAVYHNKCRGPAQQFQGREHLNALADGYVSVGTTMKEEQGRVYLVGIV